MRITLWRRLRLRFELAPRGTLRSCDGRRARWILAVVFKLIVMGGLLWNGFLFVGMCKIAACVGCAGVIL
jgi:hypothetical protein